VCSYARPRGWSLQLLKHASVFRDEVLVSSLFGDIEGRLPTVSPAPVTMQDMSAAETAGDDRRQYEIAAKVFDTLLADQIGRSDSLNASAGVFAGLGGVVVTLAGIVPGLVERFLGKAGIAAAGLSVIGGVGGLIWWRPGREPRDLQELLERILNTGDITLTEDVLLEADVQAAIRNDRRLKNKAFWVVGSAGALALAVLLLVAGIIH
jgi:hypothetical protein